MSPLRVRAPGQAPSLGHRYQDFPGGSDGKASVCKVEDLGLIPGSERLLEKGVATHSSILAWRIPWTEELDGLKSMGSQSQTQLSISTLSRFNWGVGSGNWAVCQDHSPPSGLGENGRFLRGGHRPVHPPDTAPTPNRRGSSEAPESCQLPGPHPLARCVPAGAGGLGGDSGGPATPPTLLFREDVVTAHGHLVL